MSPRFQIGDAVRIKRNYPKTHCRTPSYCRGKKGVIERICGDFRNPESLAYDGDGLPKQPLYRVRFSAAELWSLPATAANHCVEIEIYEHWLEQAS